MWSSIAVFATIAKVNSDVLLRVVRLTNVVAGCGRRPGRVKYGAQILAIHEHLAVIKCSDLLWCLRFLFLLGRHVPSRVVIFAVAVENGDVGTTRCWFRGSVYLLPGLLQTAERRLFLLCAQSGCHRLDLPRPRSHRALCRFWLCHSSEERCWRCDCRCGHPVLLGWHKQVTVRLLFTAGGNASRGWQSPSSSARLAQACPSPPLLVSCSAGSALRGHCCGRPGRFVVV